MSLRVRAVALAPSILLLAAISGCADIVNKGGEAGTLYAVSGNSQITVPNGQVLRPLVVRAVDQDGNPKAGILVKWTGSRSSKFVDDTSRTDSDGNASATWIASDVVGTITATAATDGMNSVAFDARTEPSFFEVTAYPESVSMKSIGDTVTVRVRIRAQTPNTNIDTILNVNGASWGPDAPLKTVFTGKPGMTFRSEKVGAAWMYVFFGQVAAPFRAVVQQVPADIRITVASSTAPARDTIIIGPDTTIRLSVIAVDALGTPIMGTSFSSLTWTSGNPSVITVSPAGDVRGVADGVSTVTATFGSTTSQTRVRVWTLAPASLASGGGSSCVVQQASALACWGFREVGNNSLLNATAAPEERPTFPAFTQLSMSESGACGLVASGAAFCWGRNQNGQIGNGSYLAYPGYVNTPAAVSGNHSFASISAGSARNCGLKANGEAWCWGNALEGGLGDGSYGASDCGTKSTCATTPTKVGGSIQFAQISAGSGHSCGIAVDGRGYCWGSNRYGQLGSPRQECVGWPFTSSTSTTKYHCSTTPVEIEGDRRYRSIVATQIHTCAITTDGSAYCWGGSYTGVLGTETVVDAPNVYTATPTPVQTTLKFKQIASNYGHTCAIDVGDEAWCWGLAWMLGNGNSVGSQTCTNGTCEKKPVKVIGGHTWKSLALGMSMSCGITLQDVAYCWGSNNAGQLGDGTTTNRTSPAKVLYQRHISPD